MKIAKIAAGIATITRAAEIRAPALPGAASRARGGHQRPPNRRVAALVLVQRRLERLAREVRPQLVGEDELRVGALPQQVVAQPLLAARADDEVRVVHLRRVEQPPEVASSPPPSKRAAASRISARPP